jgi:cytochrome c-type biogenesis protein CcmH/NrfG
LSRPTLPPADQALAIGILPAVSQLPAEQLHRFTYDPARVTTETTRLQAWLALQPRHRDLWLNLSILYALNQQPGPAQDALSEARQLDPNSELFVPPSPTPVF